MDERDLGRVGAFDLARLQRWVTDSVRSPHRLGEAFAREAGALVAPSARGMTPLERLEVYRDQFWLRHLHNVADDFPTLTWAIGGAEAFGELARQYLCAYPPRTWDLQRLGASMPAFVADHPARGSDRMACDAARLDWAFMEIFDAEDAPAFDPRVLASTPEEAWPRARIRLHPALRTVDLGFALLEVRDSLKRGIPVLDRPAMADVAAVVWRDSACFLRSVAIEREAFALLVRLARGESLGGACEAVALEAGSDAAIGDRVGVWFQDWVQRGWICGVNVPAGG